MEKALLLLDKIEELNSIVQYIIPVDILLRNGNVVSAYRQGAQVVSHMSKAGFFDFHKAMSRSLLKMRKGEHIDALNDIKSVLDLIKNEKNKHIDDMKNIINNCKE